MTTMELLAIMATKLSNGPSPHPLNPSLGLDSQVYTSSGHLYECVWFKKSLYAVISGNSIQHSYHMEQ